MFLMYTRFVYTVYLLIISSSVFSVCQISTAVSPFILDSIICTFSFFWIRSHQSVLSISLDLLKDKFSFIHSFYCIFSISFLYYFLLFYFAVVLLTSLQIHVFEAIYFPMDTVLPAPLKS